MEPPAADPYDVARSGSPFADVPVADYLRDAVALLLLLTALALPWDAGHDTSDRWWAVLSVLVALCALPLPYLRASGVVPGLGARHTRLLKLALIAPLVASAFAAVVNEFVHAAEDEFAFTSSNGGVGVGVAMALAGAVLAAVPRATEEPLRARAERTWWRLTVTLAVLAFAVPLLSIVAASIRYLSSDFFEGVDGSQRLWVVASNVAVGLATILVVGVPALFLVGRRIGYRRVLVVVGLTVFATSVLALVSLDDGSASVWELMYRPDPPTVFALLVEHWVTPGAGLFVLGPLMALAWSRTAERATAARHPVGGWIATARAALVVSLLAHLAGLVASLINNLYNHTFGLDAFPVTSIILMVLQGAALAVTMICLSLVRRVSTQRGALLVFCAGLMILGVVYAALVGGAATMDMISAVHVLGFFTLPALAVYSVVAPKPVRDAFGPLLPESTDSDATYGRGATTGA